MAPWMALFPPGKGGGAGGARGGKGTGMLLHRRTEGGGMPLANRTTPAKGDERAHVLPVRDAVKSRTGQRGRPRNRRRVIATETGSAAKAWREKLRKRGSRAQIPQRVGKTKKKSGEAQRTGGATVPSRADRCLVSEEIPALGRPLGAHHRMFRGLPGSCHDSHLGP